MKPLITTIALLCISAGLPADDTSRKPEDIFQQLDKNGDGVLKADEVPEQQARFFERLVRIGDKDQNGELTKDEYRAAMNRPEQQTDVQEALGQSLGQKPQRRGRPNPEQIFAHFDKNNDGKITLEEVPEDSKFRQVFERLGKEEITQQDLGKLSQMRGGPGRGPGKPGGVDRIRELDKNHDGQITLDEVPEKMRPRLERLLDRMGSDSISVERLMALANERGAEGNRPPREGDRPSFRPEGDRPPRDDDRPRFRPEGDRPPRDGDRPRFRPEGDRPPREGDRPSFRPEGDRRMGPQGRGPQGMGPAFFRAWDKNNDGMISREELATAVLTFDQMDRNNDGQLDRGELLGFDGPRGPEMRSREGFGPDRPGFRPDGDRPRFRPEGDRPPRDGDRPRFRPEGDRSPRDGDRP